MTTNAALVEQVTKGKPESVLDKIAKWINGVTTVLTALLALVKLLRPEKDGGK